MAKGPSIGYKITATVTDVKRHCGIGHAVGDSFELSCFDTAGMCGFFYHDMFPDLQTLQFGGKMPWWGQDELEVRCPDPKNQVTMILKRSSWDE